MSGGAVVIVLPGADPESVRRALVARGLWPVRLERTGRVAFRLESHGSRVDLDALERLEGVERVLAPPSTTPRLDAQPPIVRIAGRPVGIGQRPLIVAGPCAVESEERLLAIARRLSTMGVPLLRGGAFKPRTSPYAFRGHGPRALRWLADVARDCGMGVVTEALSELDVDAVAEVADIVQIGSRNMHDHALLRAVGATGRPILLKRGMAATIDEWLASAECALLSGAPFVLPCERGIRGFDPSTRNVLDVGAIALLTARGLPVLADPSHAAGRRDLVLPLARAALAAGAVGLIVEVHDAPEHALSDGPQALDPDELGLLLRELERAGAIRPARPPEVREELSP
ncbi:MAG: 3-deoxy-7-phosphoheptulonate synthase [Myxococcota bacterium]|nr:3-deoxy-7-phosphoheptulonate synthase [Myxococcota bacterium]MDW8363605.1 3-deoxy-7-phosphoheptulonate synthase [Myxococcales bacterium]